VWPGGADGDGKASKTSTRGCTGFLRPVPRQRLGPQERVGDHGTIGIMALTARGAFRLNAASCVATKRPSCSAGSHGAGNFFGRRATDKVSFPSPRRFPAEALRAGRPPDGGSGRPSAMENGAEREKDRQGRTASAPCGTWSNIPMSLYG